jgi:hypothetical protein
MKMLNAGEVQQVSGGTSEDDRAVEEWLRSVEDAMRRRNYLDQTPGWPC